MKTGLVGALIAGLVLAGVATSVHAADKAKSGWVKSDKAELALPSMQLGDYSLGLATDEPQLARAPEPTGLSAMRAGDAPQAFLGFSLSRPLPDRFWDFAR